MLTTRFLPAATAAAVVAAAIYKYRDRFVLAFFVGEGNLRDETRVAEFGGEQHICEPRVSSCHRGSR